MNRILKLLVLTIAISVLFVTLFTYASSDVDHPVEPEIPEYQTVCGSLAYHIMYPHSTCICIFPNGNSMYGNLWQCQNCYKLLVTQGDIYFGQMSSIGYWGSTAWSYPIYSDLTYVYVTDWGYTSNNYLSGYRFYVYGY